LRFTRATIISNEQVATKDALCVNEYGSSFRAASLLDVVANLQAEVSLGSSNRFTVSNPTVTGAIYTEASSYGNLFIGNNGLVQTVPIVCIRSTAPLQYTRATIISNSTAAMKDALCEAELGPAYNTASLYDVAALIRAVVSSGSSHRFTVVDANVQGAIYTEASSYGNLFFGNNGVVQTVPVACALR
jgi:hypothetical protein